MSGKNDIKRIIQDALDRDDPGAIVALGFSGRNVLSKLIRLAYDKETLIGWRAIKAIGQVARELVRTDYAVLRETVRKQFWTLNDESGGIGWSAPEIIGEIAAADPVQFQDIVPLIAEIYDIEETVFRAGVLYALSRIAEADPSAVRGQTGFIARALADRDPTVRFYGLEFTRNVWVDLSSQEKENINNQLKKMVSDEAEVWKYERNDFVNIKIGEVVKTLIRCKGGI